MYKVLWFDDEYDSLETIKEEALENELELIGYDNAQNGLAELEHNFDKYDAVVVDGLFFDESGQEEIASGGTAFGKVAKYLNEQKISGKIIPWFILSGQPSFVKEKNDFLKLFRDFSFSSGKVYDKNEDVDIEKLFSDIKKEIEKKDETRVKIMYAEAFAAFGKNHLSKENKQNLLEVLVDFETDNWSSNSFTPLRKLLEAIYKSLHEYDDRLIPLGCLQYENGKVNFKYCELRLNGKAIREHRSSRILYESCDAVLPEHLGNGIGSITKICNSASHTGEQVLTKYSLGAVIYFVIDLLIWYKKFVDENYL